MKIMTLLKVFNKRADDFVADKYKMDIVEIRIEEASRQLSKAKEELGTAKAQLEILTRNKAPDSQIEMIKSAVDKFEQSIAISNEKIKANESRLELIKLKDKSNQVFETIIGTRGIETKTIDREMDELESKVSGKTIYLSSIASGD